MVDWPNLRRREFLAFRKTLNNETLAVLSRPGFTLDQLNEIGCYHRVKDEQIFRQMQEEYQGTVPEHWMSKGNSPGIWTALFHASNAAFHDGLPEHIMQLFFKPGYKLYDENKPEQRLAWEHWEVPESNPWLELANHRGEPLASRLWMINAPFHRQFYEQNRFGAFLGYSDYRSVVAILPEAIERVEFLG